MCVLVAMILCSGVSIAQSPVAILNGTPINHTLSNGVFTCNVGNVTGDWLLRI